MRHKSTLVFARPQYRDGFGTVSTVVTFPAFTVGSTQGATMRAARSTREEIDDYGKATSSMEIGSVKDDHMKEDSS